MIGPTRDAPRFAQAWVGLGANLDEPVDQMKQALVHLDAHADIELNAVSSLYSSAPVGYTDQPEFFNAVAGVRTCLDADALLRILLGTEDTLGRVRTGPRFGPRRVDLDLLLYCDQQVRTADLIVPHPRMSQRRFVLAPLVELWPQAWIPGFGPAADALGQCEDQLVERLGTKGAKSPVTVSSMRLDLPSGQWPGPCRLPRDTDKLQPDSVPRSDSHQ